MIPPPRVRWRTVLLVVACRRMCARCGRGVRDGTQRSTHDRHGEKLGLAESVVPHRLVVDHQDAAAVRLRDPQRRGIGFEQPLVAFGDGLQSFEVAPPLREERRERQSGER